MHKKAVAGKLGVISLGCSKNLVDTEIMMGQLIKAGWEYTTEFAQAELILVNTCGFIETAKAESVQHILEMAEYKQPGKGVCRTLIVAGCLVQRYCKELSTDIPEVDLWLGLAEIDKILDFLQAEQKIRVSALATKGSNGTFLNNQNLPRFQATLHHTAYVKIAEGCDHYCSYCAIPLIKGRYCSRTLNSILTEVKDLVDKGVREINLIAQDISGYGKDLIPRSNLTDLLEHIITLGKPSWIRLLYAYPKGIESSLLQLMARESSICKYIDLPLQHINSRILKLMNRPESTQMIKEKLAMIRQIVPEIALRTTFIVGFPSETEAEFSELLEFVAENKFDHVGVFSYSREEGTKAYDIQPQIEEEIKQERRERILAEQQKISTNLLKRQLRQEQVILIDQVLNNGTAVGRTERLAPDVDGVVYLQNYQGKPGSFVRGLMVDSDEYNLKAQEILPTSTGIF